MKPFEYHVATSPAAAVAPLARHPAAAYLAGGTNLVDHMKLGVAEPDLLVDVSRLELSEVTATDDGGVSIGANVRNSDLAAHPVIRSRYPMLARALLSGASGQLRNAATTAGNLPAQWVIHTVGPVWSASEDRSALLASCYRESLRVADELGAATVAFPAISTGVYGWPMDDGARIAVETLRGTATRVREVRFGLFSADAFRIFDGALGANQGA